MRTKRSIYNLIFNLFNVVVTFALGIIIPRLFLVSLGSEANGLVASVGQVFSYVGLMEAGIGATAIQALYKPIAEEDRLQINRILSASNRYYRKIGVIYIGCVFLVALFYPCIVQSSLPTWQVVGVVLFSGLGNAINFLLQQNYVVLLAAEGRGYVTTNLNLIINVLVSVTKAILLLNGFNVVYIVGAQFVLTLLRILLLRFYMGKQYKWVDTSVEPDRSALTKQRYVMAQQISYFIYSNTDILLLTVFCDLKVVSVYTIYNMVIGMIESVTGTITTSFAFALGQLYSVDFQKFKKMYKIYDSVYMTLVFALFTVVYLCIIPFLSLYTRGIRDTNYLDYKLALLFVVLKMVTTLRSQSQNAVNFAGHFKETEKMAIIETVSNLAVSMMLVSYIGIYGVVIGSIVSTFYRGIAVTNYVNRIILKDDKKESIAKYFRWTVYLLAFVLSCFLAKIVIPASVTNYSEWIKLAVLCTLCSMGIYSILWMLLDWAVAKDTIAMARHLLWRNGE